MVRDGGVGERRQQGAYACHHRDARRSLAAPAPNMAGSTPPEESRPGLVTYRDRGMAKAACGSDGGGGTRCRM
jgi:hypothetical protein